MNEQRTDVIQKLVHGAVGIVPGGSLLTEFWKTPLERRKDVWFQAIEKRIQILESNHLVKIEEVFERDDFLDAFMTASVIAVRTSNLNKIKALENFVCNVALYPNVDEAVDSICLSLLSDLSGAHLYVLSRIYVLNDDALPPQNVISGYYDDQEKWNLVKYDLGNRGLIGPFGSAGLSDIAMLLVTRISSDHLV
jgi:hypothetical protein